MNTKLKEVSQAIIMAIFKSDDMNEFIDDTDLHPRECDISGAQTFTMCKWHDQSTWKACQTDWLYKIQGGY